MQPRARGPFGPLVERRISVIADTDFGVHRSVYPVPPPTALPIGVFVPPFPDSSGQLQSPVMTLLPLLGSK